MSQAARRLDPGPIAEGPRSVAHARPSGRRADPWDPVLNLGDRAVKLGSAIGLVLAFGTHGYASARAMLALYDMQKAVDGMRATIHEFLWTEYDIDLKPEQKQEPEKPKEEPPPPPPEPDPAPQPAPKAQDKPQDPYDEKPAPVQAAKILTAPPDPNKFEDLTDKGIVSGDNTNGPLGGQSAAAGTSTVITHNPAADLTGKPGGTGTGAPQAPPPGPPKPDLSAPAGIVGGSSWSNCPFPDEADTDQIDFAQVTLIVTVRPDGSPQSVQVTSDPGHGFGRAARMCALARKYNAGKDKDGNAATMSTPPIRVTFSR
jgi:protein TonB